MSYVITRLRTFVRSLRTPKETHWSDDCPLAELTEDELDSWGRKPDGPHHGCQHHPRHDGRIWEAAAYDDNLARLRDYYDNHSTVEEMRLKES